ncbi:MAG: hypothetical protein KA112_03835 [Alphaproteobacteria bacterium]|nr:hypothetical protein [Alphaproteobacteria bacterium]
MIKKILCAFYLGAHFLSFSCKANPHYIKNSLDPEKQVDYFVKPPSSS